MIYMDKVDCKKLKEFYKPSGGLSAVRVPSWKFLLINSKGDPNGSDVYQKATESLCLTSYS